MLRLMDTFRQQESRESIGTSIAGRGLAAGRMTAVGKEIQTLQATPLTFISEKRGERDQFRACSAGVSPIRPGFIHGESK